LPLSIRDRDAEHLLNGVELFGTEPVRAAALRVHAALEQAAEKRPSRVEIFEAPPGYVDEASRASLQALIDLLQGDVVAERMDDLIEAMRADVAPPEHEKRVESSDGKQRRSLPWAGRAKSRSEAGGRWFEPGTAHSSFAGVSSLRGCGRAGPPSGDR